MKVYIYVPQLHPSTYNGAAEKVPAGGRRASPRLNLAHQPTEAAAAATFSLLRRWSLVTRLAKAKTQVAWVHSFASTRQGKGIRFKVGTGLSDADRRNPPLTGTVITYKFFKSSQMPAFRASPFL
jgi:hypothetical protein